MKILVVGGGGREHAIVRALKRTWRGDDELTVLCAPGNPGIARDAQCFGDVSDADVDAIVHLAREQSVDLVAVGPEVPLVAGLVDECAKAGIPAFGPAMAAARLEGSKIFSKDVMEAAGVPTAGHVEVHSRDEALAQIELSEFPAVFKSDGLAAGKGVIICPDAASAREAVEQYFTEQRFGETDVIIEDFLDGKELSLLAICDGERALPLMPARDFKRIFDGDEGPNTGGMGSFSPVPEVSESQIESLSRLVHDPIVDEMKRRGTPFHGILYAGIMMTAAGPKVLEYNARFGDPETQALLPRLESSLAELMLASTRRDGLKGVSLRAASDAAVTITLASAGYPQSSSKGDVISGLDDVSASIEITHAGTALNDAGEVVTAGGRVLNVTALGATVAEARAAAYAAAEKITFDGRQMRSDIAAGI